MCIISYFPGGVETPVKGISNGAIVNNDGHGWVVAKGDQLLVGKSMQFDEALDGLLEARAELGPSSLGMFHSRWGTHGEMGAYNIHPFHFAEDSVMAHNGILPMKYHPKWKDRRSDTRIFVDRIGNFVDNPNGVPSRRGAARLASLIEGGNKLVFISTRSGKPKVRIVNADMGVQVDGVWYSNSGYLTDYSWYGVGNRRKVYSGTGGLQSGWQAWGMDADPISLSSRYDGYEEERITDLGPGKELEVWSGPERCDECGSTDLDQDLGVCMECVTCLDCHDNYSYCLCWRPGKNFTKRDWEDAQQREQAVQEEYAEIIQIAGQRDKALAQKRENIPTIG